MKKKSYTIDIACIVAMPNVHHINFPRKNF